MTARHAIRGLALAAAVTATLAALGGCHPTLAAESTVPPGRAGRLDPVTGFWGVQSYRLELSQGAAIAISCSDGGPCEQLTATSDDAAIAEVRAAALQTLRGSPFAGTLQPAAALVIIGKAPGTTTIRLRSKPGDRDVRVTISAPPPALAAAVQPARP